MTAMTDLRAPWAELGRLAELAAMAVDEQDAALVDGRLAVALAALPAHRPEIDRLATAARDVARPLHSRVATIAALHVQLTGEMP